MKRWFVVGTLLFAVGCKNAPSEDQCKQLLEHLVDLEFKKGGADKVEGANKEDVAKKKAEVAAAKPEFIDVCVNKTAKERVACALAAQSLEAVSKCDEAK
ncbi:MAG TPA: hypothetical protein VGM39_09780 [Kofleriaceae bacterium]